MYMIWHIDRLEVGRKKRTMANMVHVSIISARAELRPRTASGRVRKRVKVVLKIRNNADRKKSQLKLYKSSWLSATSKSAWTRRICNAFAEWAEVFSYMFAYNFGFPSAQKSEIEWCMFNVGVSSFSLRVEEVTLVLAYLRLSSRILKHADWVSTWKWIFECDDRDNIHQN